MKKAILIFMSLIVIYPLYSQSNFLSAHWPLQGDVQDASGNKRNLKTSGRNWSWVEDESRGKVFESKSSEVKLSIPVNPASPLNLKSNFTISFWVKNTGEAFVFNNTDSRLIAKNIQFQINGDGNAVRTRFRIEGGNVALSPSRSQVSFENGKWHHIILTVSADYFATLYVNGEAISKKQLPGSPETSGNVIEVATAPGRFSDVRIYSKALSAEEVKEF